MAGSGLPFDIETEQGLLAQKQALLQGLLKSSFNPQQGQMVSGHYIRPHWLSALLPAASVLMSQTVQDRGAEAQRGLTQRYNSGLGTALKGYFDTQRGTPGDTLSDKGAHDLLVNDRAPGMLNDGSAADPRRAAVEALTSGYAPLRELGKSDLTELMKEGLQDARLAAASNKPNKGLSAKEILMLAGKDKYDPDSAREAAMTGDVSLLRPSTQELTVNGQVFAGTPTAGYKSVLDARDKFGKVMPVGGKGAEGQANAATGEVKFAPAGGGNTTINVDTSQKAGTKFAEKLAEGRAGTILKSFESAQSAVKALDAIGEAQKDFTAGTKSGITANVALGVAKFAKALGLPDDPAIANTEAFRASMARETLNLVKGLGTGTGISNADREFAEKASGGSITLDDRAIARLMNISKAAAGNIVMENKRLLSAQRGATGTLPEDLASFEVPLNVNGSEGFDFDTRSQKFVTTGEVPRSGAAAGGQKGPRRIRFEDMK